MICSQHQAWTHSSFTPHFLSTCCMPGSAERRGGSWWTAHSLIPSSFLPFLSLIAPFILSCIQRTQVPSPYSVSGPAWGNAGRAAVTRIAHDSCPHRAHMLSYKDGPEWSRLGWEKCRGLWEPQGDICPRLVLGEAGKHSRN